MESAEHSTLVATPPTTLFVRDSMQWVGYSLVGIYCFIMSAFGPVLPLLRGELHLSYTLAALHLSAYALGVLFAGSFGELAMNRLGLNKCFWGCGGLLMAAVLLILVGHNIIFTIFGAWLVGVGGSTMGQTATTIMSERFQEERTIAITELNIAASAFSSVAPLVLGAVLYWHLNWRFAFLPMFLLFGTLYFFFNRVAEPFSGYATQTVAKGKLPLAYWGFWAVILFSIAGEWSIVFWCSDYLQQVVGLSRADASSSTSIFLVAVITGRVLGTRLARSMPLRLVLPLVAVVALAGFFIFWLAPTAPIKLIGLFLAGLGNANVYPLSYAQALATAPGQASVASARMSVASGTANLLAPLIMGAIADRSGIWPAYGLVAILWTLVVVLVFAAENISRRAAVGAPTSA